MSEDGPTAKATQMAHQGCVGLLGSSVTFQLADLLSRLLSRVLGNLAEVDAEGGIHSESGANDVEVQILEPATTGPRQTLEQCQRFELVVKNSFIEVAEDPPSPLTTRRTRSLGADVRGSRSSEAFTLVVDWRDEASRAPQRQTPRWTGHPNVAHDEHVASCAAPAESASAAPAEEQRPRSPPPPSRTHPQQALPLEPVVHSDGGAVTTSSTTNETAAEGRLDDVPGSSQRNTVFLKNIPSVYTTHRLL